MVQVQVTEASEYMERVAGVLGGDGSLHLELSISSVDEAKLAHKRMVQQQKQLRQIKKEINQDMKNIRAAYKEASDNVQPSASSSIFGGLFGKKGYAKGNVAQQRRDLRQRRDGTLEPYNQAKLTIDDLLIQMDGAKLSIKNYIDEES